MRIAVISDIHSNYEALKSILEQIKKEKVDIIYSLGDVVGYGASPNECMECLKKNKIISIVGNHDYGVATEDYDFMNKDAIEAIKYTIKVIEEEYKDSIYNWEYIRYIDRILLFHGMPQKERLFEYLFFTEQVQDVLKYITTYYPEVMVAFFGHTHEKEIYEYDFLLKKLERIEISYDWVKLRNDRLYLFNPGSVGQPRDGDRFASAIIYDQNKHIVKFIKADYNIAVEAAKIMDAGLPEYFAERLYKGN